LKKLIIRVLDCVNDIHLALHRAYTALNSFLEDRKPEGTVRIRFAEQGNVAVVFSDDHHKDMIAYRWESEVKKEC